MKIDEIKTYYERAKDAKLPDGDTDYQKQEEFLFWMLDSGHLGKLIERVQELEEENNQLEQDVYRLERLEANTAIEKKKVDEQNKRYREALHEIYYKKYSHYGYRQIVLKALEETE